MYALQFILLAVTSVIDALNHVKQYFRVVGR